MRAFCEKTGGLARGTGFLARFLVAWPQSTQGTRLFKEAPTAWPKLTAFHHRIEAILSMPVQFDSDGTTLMPSMMTLSPPAKQYWIEYHDEVEKALAVGGEFADIRDVASKSADNAARIAALFQILQHGGGSVSLEALEPACQIAAWYLGESRRFLGGIALPKELMDALRLMQFLGDYSKTKGQNETTTHVLQNRGPVRDKTRLAAALDELVEYGYIRLVLQGKKKLVRINPKFGEVAP
jgi:putative DNA primase/helicase